MKIVYYESCLDQDDAIRREKYLKSAWGKRYLRNRLRNYLTGQGRPNNDNLYPCFEPCREGVRSPADFLLSSQEWGYYAETV